MLLVSQFQHLQKQQMLLNHSRVIKYIHAVVHPQVRKVSELTENCTCNYCVLLMCNYVTVIIIAISAKTK